MDSVPPRFFQLSSQALSGLTSSSIPFLVIQEPACWQDDAADGEILQHILYGFNTNVSLMHPMCCSTNG